MKQIAVLGAMAAAMLVQPAMATPKTPTPTIIYTPSITGVPGWTTAKVFQDFQSVTSTQQYAPKAGETVTGNGVYAIYDKSTKNTYLDISGTSSYQVSFANSPEQYFSFVVGDLSSEDKLVLAFKNGTSLTLQGLGIVGSTNSSLLGSTGRVNIDMTGQSPITSALFTTTSSCAEFFIDGLAGAAPEPGTWMLMIVGFGLVGASLRRQRVAARIAFA